MFHALILPVVLAQTPPAPSAAAVDLPILVVEHDDTVVTSSCRLLFPSQPIRDRNGNGVVHIAADGIVVDLGGTTLRGAPLSLPPDVFEGTGIVVTGRRVTLRNGAVSGFRCGVLAQSSDGSTFEKLDLSDNYAMRLFSSEEKEDGRDWLWPHQNDAREWVTRYGAGLCVERSSDVTIRDVTSHRTQNGILLDRVEKSRVYDNDCSYLSGWGLAMWRSNSNVISRNAFDFCIRGYSHGVYSRGQDSAGILLFEQCCDNVFALNSATHCGDGVFGFAGREALGENPPPAGASADFHAGRGSNRNLFIGNDFSFAAAHGLEMTFSFGNVVAENRFEGNHIAGLWAGYCRDTLVTRNSFAKNGGPDGPGEGGGIDIEHGRGNRIVGNEFADEQVAVELWTDEDAGLRTLAWVQTNGAGSAGNELRGNRFNACRTSILLRESVDDREEGNTAGRGAESGEAPLPSIEGVPSLEEFAKTLPGLNRPVGARREVGGREAIRMTAFHPWDGRGRVLSPTELRPDVNMWRLFGDAIKGCQVFGQGSLRVNQHIRTNGARVSAELPGRVMPYYLRLATDNGPVVSMGCITLADWRVTFFPSPCDPRTDLAHWREAASGPDSVVVEVPAVHFEFGEESPAALKLGPTAKAVLAAEPLPADNFGTVAKGTLEFPKGEFVLHTISDDGVRVLVDGKPVIEDWSHHAPRSSTATIVFEEPTKVEIVIEHFDLAGPSTLSFFIYGDLNRSRWPR